MGPRAIKRLSFDVTDENIELRFFSDAGGLDKKRMYSVMHQLKKMVKVGKFCVFSDIPFAISVYLHRIISLKRALNHNRSVITGF